jgi:hypothetical protein
MNSFRNFKFLVGKMVHIPKWEFWDVTGTRMYNGYPATKDDHDSWETCTTSAECKTVITAVLTVMSSMDPHMISGTRVGW